MSSTATIKNYMLDTNTSQIQHCQYFDNQLYFVCANQHFIMSESGIYNNITTQQPILQFRIVQMKSSNIRIIIIRTLSGMHYFSQLDNQISSLNTIFSKKSQFNNLVVQTFDAHEIEVHSTLVVVTVQTILQQNQLTYQPLIHLIKCQCYPPIYTQIQSQKSPNLLLTQSQQQILIFNASMNEKYLRVAFLQKCHKNQINTYEYSLTPEAETKILQRLQLQNDQNTSNKPQLAYTCDYDKNVFLILIQEYIRIYKVSNQDKNNQLIVTYRNVFQVTHFCVSSNFVYLASQNALYKVKKPKFFEYTERCQQFKDYIDEKFDYVNQIHGMFCSNFDQNEITIIHSV